MGFRNFATGQVGMGKDFDILPEDGLRRDFDHSVLDGKRDRRKKRIKKNTILDKEMSRDKGTTAV